MCQAILNIGAVTSVLPITGIPLPLISYGGSSLAVTLFSVGLLVGIARRDPEVAAAIASRRSGRKERLRPAPRLGPAHPARTEASLRR